MKILIVGNDPTEIGGVANYTRPLALKFNELGHDVFYLYSGAFRSRYDLFMRPYLKIRYDLFPFECAEIINSTNLPFNFGHPELDMFSEGMDRVIKGYIERTKPDVMHVHSRLGLPASVNELAHELGVAVLNTIHVYGYICQRRVMIDRDGELCQGPFDLRKCAWCTGSPSYLRNRLRALFVNFKEGLKARHSGVFKTLQSIKRNVLSRYGPTGEKKKSSGLNWEYDEPSCLSNKLEQRLQYCIQALNRYSLRTICVSTDVKNILIRYGVDESRLLVQHIGSTIAERQTSYRRTLHNPFVIGNIGGVNHYKGTHVLLDAIGKLKRNDFIVKIFGRYNELYISDLIHGRNSLPVVFTGRYSPEEIPEILKQIDIMVLPSICNDTAPQTIFESFSGGVPIIASNIGGFPDFIHHDLNGLLFEPGNSDDLARKIDQVLSKPNVILEYQKNIPKLKTISGNANELLVLYLEMLAQRKANGSILAVREPS
ncbi:MAG: glycosyl transferase family 1 [candidate division Zixibacteria bacterium RBG_16_53_22]|nr:MAG: glycosyl transferase family 1 [candidate division Zixibacteria bacterium RBG_16_53_22]